MKEMSKLGMEKITGCLWKCFSPPTLEKKIPDPFFSSLSAVAVELECFSKLAENEWYLTKNTSNVGQLHRKSLTERIKKTEAKPLLILMPVRRLHWSLEEINPCFLRKLEAPVQDVPHLSLTCSYKIKRLTKYS